MRKKLLFISISAVIFLLPLLSQAQEVIELISYYPAPYGAYKSMLVTGGDNGDGILTLAADNDDDNENDNPELVLQQDGGTVNAFIMLEGDAGTRTPSSLANALLIGSENNVSSVQFLTADIVQMTITSAGKVGLGTNSPTAKLEVAGGMGTGARIQGDMHALECTSSIGNGAAILINGGRGGIEIKDSMSYGIKIDTGYMGANGVQAKSQWNAIHAETTAADGEWAGYFNGHVKITDYTELDGTHHPGGDLEISGNGSVAGDMAIMGNQTVIGDVQINGDEQIGNNLLVNKKATVNKDLEVKGRADLAIPNIPVFWSNSQRDSAMTNPKEGDLIWNRTVNGGSGGIQVYISDDWRDC